MKKPILTQRRRLLRVAPMSPPGFGTLLYNRKTMLPAAGKVYGPNPRARNIMLGMWLLIAGPLTALALIEREPVILLAVLLISAIMLPIFWYALRAARLILTAEGIEAKQAGARVATAWSNIAAIRMQRGAEGLVLHQPMTGSGPERLAAVAGMSVGGAPMYDDERRQLLAEQRFIPLDGFSHWLHKGDLYEKIRERSTALSDELAQVPGSSSVSEKTTKKTIALIVLTIVVSVGLAVASIISPTTKSAVYALISLALTFALGAYACVNATAAVQRFRAGQYGWFVFSLLLALLQALFALVALGSAIDMFSGR